MVSKHVLFESHPVIPVAFLIHERKFQIAHKELMAHLKEEVPSLCGVKSPVPIVVDDEIALCNAIDEVLPGVVRVRCWNHTINAVKLWLQLEILMSSGCFQKNHAVALQQEDATI